MTTIRIKLPTIDQVNFTIEAEQEDTPVRGNALISGNPEMDRKEEDMILRRLRSGNQWAWCRVIVTVSWNGITAFDSLGCCSYKSESEFKKCVYYQDMKNEAFADLISKIMALKGK